jgi:O-antigen ligase
VLSSAPSAPAVGAVPSGRSFAGTIRLIQIEVWLLVAIPPTTRFAPLGAIGNPALILALCMFALWAITVLAPSLSTPRRCPPVRGVLIAFAAAVLISYAALQRDPPAGDIALSADVFLVTLMAFSGVALFVAEGVPTMPELRRIIRTFVAAGAAMAVVAIMQARLGFDLTEYIAKIPLLSQNSDAAAVGLRGGLARPAGTATHPIEFGVVEGVALALAIYTSLYDRAWSKVKRWGALALIGVGIPLSLSRSAILVAACVIAALLIGATNAIRVRVLPVLFAFVVAIFVAFPSVLGTFQTLFAAGAGDPSIATRLSDYDFVSSAVASSPWVGSGPGSLPSSIRILDDQYLLTLVELGSIGLLALVVLLGAIPWLAAGGRKRFVDEGDRLLGALLVGAGLGIMVASGTFDAFSFAMFTTIVALLMGIAGRYWCIGREEGRPATIGGRPAGQ